MNLAKVNKLYSQLTPHELAASPTALCQTVTRSESVAKLSKSGRICHSFSGKKVVVF
ncbi:MAG: hypothetical protein Q8N96_15015 [Methylovulum sp.]|nr:hypothetical protein [Methylovulum sp.]